MPIGVAQFNRVKNMKVIQTIAFLVLSAVSTSGFAVHEPIVHRDYMALPFPQLHIEVSGETNPLKKINKEVDGKEIVLAGWFTKTWMDTENNNSYNWVLANTPTICEHTGIPLPTQVVLIENPRGLPLIASEEQPFYAFGKIRVEQTIDHIYTSTYTMELHDVIPYDVSQHKTAQHTSH